jgi:hypothetical protein
MDNNNDYDSNDNDNDIDVTIQMLHTSKSSSREIGSDKLFDSARDGLEP